MLEKLRLIKQLEITTEFEVSYEASTTEPLREERVLAMGHETPDVCFFKGLGISLVS
jgi:hypothetical protein